MEESSEREKKLLEYISFLLDVVALYGGFISSISGNLGVFGKKGSELNIQEKFEEFKKYCSDTYAIDILDNK